MHRQMNEVGIQRRQREHQADLDERQKAAVYAKETKELRDRIIEEVAALTVDMIFPLLLNSALENGVPCQVKFDKEKIIYYYIDPSGVAFQCSLSQCKNELAGYLRWDVDPEIFKTAQKQLQARVNAEIGSSYRVSVSLSKQTAKLTRPWWARVFL